MADIIKLLKNMSLKEKIGQLQQGLLSEATEQDIIKKIRNKGIGSCILATNALAGNTSQSRFTAEFVNKIQKYAVEETGIPLIFGRDVVHGFEIIFPVPLGQAASWNRELIQNIASAMAEEAAIRGVNNTYAPMLDLARDPRWGRIIESPGEDPYLGAEFAKASVKGIQGNDLKAENKIAACLKHFIGYGAAEGGRDYNKSEISEYTLRNIYMPAFKAGIDSGCATVMNSFSEINGEPCASSEFLFRKLLKGELKFDGFVVSDYSSIEQLEDKKVAVSRRECAYLAIKAGIDVEMVSTCYAEELEHICLENHEVEKLVDDAVIRILRVKDMLGLFENPYIRIRSKDEDEILRKKHIELSLKAAKESAVLLKNENNILPLSSERKIMLAGPYVNEKRSLFGSWAPDGDTSHCVTFSEGMKKCFPKDNIKEPGNEFFYETTYREGVKCDTAVLALGEHWSVTGERSCMASIEIPSYQMELVKKMKSLGLKVIAVIFAGRPLALEELMNYADAVIYMWHPGTMGALAAAELISGKAVPSGKLPVTMLRHTGQIPLYYNHPSLPVRYDEEDDGYYKEPYFPTYNDVRSMPLFPFGFGMSYTKFKYEDIKCDKRVMSLEEIEKGKCFELSITVENIGDYDAQEVIQCYVSDKISRKTRPIKELKGFEKVLILKGKQYEAVFNIGYNELGYYNNEYMVEKGDFDIYIGSDCYTRNVITVTVM